MVLLQTFSPKYQKILMKIERPTQRSQNPQEQHHEPVVPLRAARRRPEPCLVGRQPQRRDMAGHTAALALDARLDTVAHRLRLGVRQHLGGWHPDQRQYTQRFASPNDNCSARASTRAAALLKQRAVGGRGRGRASHSLDSRARPAAPEARHADARRGGLDEGGQCVWQVGRGGWALMGL